MSKDRLLDDVEEWTGGRSVYVAAGAYKNGLASSESVAGHLVRELHRDGGSDAPFVANG